MQNHLDNEDTYSTRPFGLKSGDILSMKQAKTSVIKINEDDTGALSLKKAFKCHKKHITSIDISHKNRYLASSAVDGTLMVWSFGKQVRANSFKTDKRKALLCVKFRPDGEILASGGESERIRLWLPNKCQGISTAFTAHHSAVTTLSWRPDGERLVSGSMDRVVKIWNGKRAQYLSALIGHKQWVTSCEYEPLSSTVGISNTIATGSHDRTVRIWDARSSKQVQILSNQLSLINCVQFHPQQTHYIACTDCEGTIKIWDRRAGDVVASDLQKQSNLLDSASSSPSSPKNAIVQTYEQSHGAIRVASYSSGQKFLHQLNHATTSLRFHPSGFFLFSTGTDGTIRIWDLLKGRLGHICDTVFEPIQISTLVQAILSSKSMPSHRLAMSHSGKFFLSSVGIPNFVPSRSRLASNTRSSVRRLNSNRKLKSDDTPLFLPEELVGKIYNPESDRIDPYRSRFGSNDRDASATHPTGKYDFDIVGLPNLIHDACGNQMHSLAKSSVKKKKKSSPESIGHVLLWRARNMVQTSIEETERQKQEEERLAAIHKAEKSERKAAAGRRIEALYKHNTIKPSSLRKSAFQNINFIPWVRTGGGWEPLKTNTRSQSQEHHLSLESSRESLSLPSRNQNQPSVALLKQPGKSSLRSVKNGSQQTPLVLSNNKSHLNLERNDSIIESDAEPDFSDGSDVEVRSSNDTSVRKYLLKNWDTSVPNSSSTSSNQKSPSLQPVTSMNNISAPRLINESALSMPDGIPVTTLDTSEQSNDGNISSSYIVDGNAQVGSAVVSHPNENTIHLQSVGLSRTDSKRKLNQPIINSGQSKQKNSDKHYNNQNNNDSNSSLDDENFLVRPYSSNNNNPINVPQNQIKVNHGSVSKKYNHDSDDPSSDSDSQTPIQVISHQTSPTNLLNISRSTSQVSYKGRQKTPGNSERYTQPAGGHISIHHPRNISDHPNHHSMSSKSFQPHISQKSHTKVHREQVVDSDIGQYPDSVRVVPNSTSHQFENYNSQLPHTGSQKRLNIPSSMSPSYDPKNNPSSLRQSENSANLQASLPKPASSHAPVFPRQFNEPNLNSEPLSYGYPNQISANSIEIPHSSSNSAQIPFQEAYQQSSQIHRQNHQPQNIHRSHSTLNPRNPNQSVQTPLSRSYSYQNSRQHLPSSQQPQFSNDNSYQVRGTPTSRISNSQPQNLSSAKFEKDSSNNSSPNQNPNSSEYLAGNRQKAYSQQLYSDQPQSEAARFNLNSKKGFNPLLDSPGGAFSTNMLVGDRRFDHNPLSGSNDPSQERTARSSAAFNKGSNNRIAPQVISSGRRNHQSQQHSVQPHIHPKQNQSSSSFHATPKSSHRKNHRKSPTRNSVENRRRQESKVEAPPLNQNNVASEMKSSTIRVDRGSRNPVHYNSHSPMPQYSRSNYESHDANSLNSPSHFYPNPGAQMPVHTQQNPSGPQRAPIKNSQVGYDAFVSNSQNRSLQQPRHQRDPSPGKIDNYPSISQRPSTSSQYPQNPHRQQFSSSDPNHSIPLIPSATESPVQHHSSSRNTIQQHPSTLLSNYGNQAKNNSIKVAPLKSPLKTGLHSSSEEQRDDLLSYSNQSDTDTKNPQNSHSSHIHPVPVSRQHSSRQQSPSPHSTESASKNLVSSSLINTRGPTKSDHLQDSTIKQPIQKHQSQTGTFVRHETQPPQHNISPQRYDVRNTNPSNFGTENSLEDEFRQSTYTSQPQNLKHSNLSPSNQSQNLDVPNIHRTKSQGRQMPTLSPRKSFQSHSPHTQVFRENQLESSQIPHSYSPNPINQPPTLNPSQNQESFRRTPKNSTAVPSNPQHYSHNSQQRNLSSNINVSPPREHTHDNQRLPKPVVSSPYSQNREHMNRPPLSSLANPPIHGTPLRSAPNPQHSTFEDQPSPMQQKNLQSNTSQDSNNSTVVVTGVTLDRVNWPAYFDSLDTTHPFTESGTEVPPVLHESPNTSSSNPS